MPPKGNPHLYRRTIFVEIAQFISNICKNKNYSSVMLFLWLFQKSHKSTQIYALLRAIGLSFGLRSGVCNGLIKRLFNSVIVNMSINIIRHAYVGVSHKSLQLFTINPCFRHVGTECMSQHVGANLWNDLPISFHKPLICSPHMILQVHTNFWFSLFVQKQETSITVNHHFDFGSSPIL